MNRRFFEVFRLDLGHHLRRPLFWILTLILGFLTLEMSRGEARISSGSTAVGGDKAFLTSQFAVAQILTYEISLIYAMFIAVAAGMLLIRDDEHKVGELLHSTPLRAGEYVWGKFMAVLVAFVGVLGVHLLLMVFFNHGLPHENPRIIGPFRLANYLMPALLMALPVMVLYAGTCFAFGAWTRKPVLVFAVPLAVLVGGLGFFWDWSPSWLGAGWNRLFMIVDLAGYRWLKETWLEVDRGVAFYNTAAVGLDGTFLLNRLLCLGIGLGCVALSARRFAAMVRGRTAAASRPARDARKRAAAEVAGGGGLDGVEAVPRPAASLAMRSRAPGFLSGALEVVRVELRELASHPGLYLFVPLILLQTFGSAVTTVGAFDAPLLHTPGTLAVGMMNTLTLLICMLLLFYTVESLQRERSTGLSPIHYATPVGTASFLFGKALANTLVGLAVVLAVLGGCALDLAVQRRVAFDIVPFALTWGLLVAPTFLVWTAFVSASFAVTGNRYGAYALGFGALVATGYFQMRDKMNWVGNWDLWSTVRWSDISVFELDRSALVLNRLVAVGLAAFFIALTVRIFARREPDATQVVHRLRPGALARSALALVPFAILPLTAGATLWVQVQQGMGGKASEKQTRDYWKQNVYTWREALLPAVTFADVDVDLEPARSWFRVRGTYRLVNRHDVPLKQVPVTAGFHWDSLAWTMNGKDYKPEDRTRLCVFTPPEPLQPGDSLEIGFRYEARHPMGVTRNGGGAMTFVLPSSVVLTGFDGPEWVPVLGFQNNIGIKDENRAEPRVYPDDFHTAVNPAFLPGGEHWLRARIRVTGPADLRYNATGVLVSETVKNGRRTALWETDRPVKLFNLVAGRWAERRGQGVSVFYHPAHAYNLDEMMQALEGSRRWFSEWFAPYPWRDLRVSEFPNLATYAQGPVSNITFSEGIGFLTKSEPKANLAFWVTTHEAAHQWWGNILMPATGPGGQVLSEGLAHFSTILLTEKVKGMEQRVAFCRTIEDRYGNFRRREDERSLLRTDGSRPTDRTVFYDKSGWVMWMLVQLMGRDAVIAGLREFVAEWRDGDDHPTLTELIATLRRHAPDPTAYDAFVQQWFREVVVPEYKLLDMKRERAGDGWRVTATVRNVGTGRMPVEVAAVRGERFPKRAAKEPYREARAGLVLGAGESRVVTIRSDFEPERLVVDPDYLVLQLERVKATAKL